MTLGGLAGPAVAWLAAGYAVMAAWLSRRASPGPAPGPAPLLFAAPMARRAPWLQCLALQAELSGSPNPQNFVRGEIGVAGSTRARLRHCLPL